MTQLFKELEQRMEEKYHSGFRINTLDWCTKLAILTLCEIIEKRFKMEKEKKKMKLHRTKAQIQQHERFRAKGSLCAAQALFKNLSEVGHFPSAISADFAMLSNLCKSILTRSYWKSQSKKRRKR